LPMPARTVKVASSSGLHARPAAIFSQAASEQPVPVTIETSGAAPVKASSILMLLTLDVAHGDEVTLRAEGEGAEESLDLLSALLARNLDEEFQDSSPAPGPGRAAPPRMREGLLRVRRGPSSNRYRSRSEAVAAGFEPAVAMNHTSFRVMHLRPLGHATVAQLNRRDLARSNSSIRDASHVTRARRAAPPRRCPWRGGRSRARS